MKKTAIIDYAISTDDAAELARGFDADGDVKRVVLFRSRVPAACAEHAGKARLSEDYFEDGDYREIDRKAYSLVREWHTPPGGAKTTEFRGMALGNFVEYKLAETLLRIIKDSTALSRALDGWDGAVVLCCKSAAFRETALHVCARRGCEVEEKRRPSSAPSHCIYEAAEWSAVEKGAQVLESLTRVSLSCGGEERPTLVHDGSRFRALFGKAGCRTEDVCAGSGLRTAGVLLRNLPLFVRAGLERRRIAREAARHFADVWRRLEADEGFHASFQRAGVPWPLARPYLEDLFLRRFPAIAAAVAHRRAIYRALGVEAIIVNDDVQLIKKIDLVAARCPSLYVQHGVSGESNGESAVSTDVMAAWGEADREWWISLGNPQEKFVVTGNPKFDGLQPSSIFTSRNVKEMQGLRTRLKMEDLAGMAVFAAQIAPKRSAYDTDDEEETLAWGICRAMAEFPEKRLVIKLHPNQREREGMYRAISERCGLKGYRIIRDIPLGLLLEHCEIFITESSTAAYEAVLWDVPILIVNLTKREDIVPYVPGGVALGAYDEKEIAPALRRLIGDDAARNALAERRRAFIERYMHRVDGRATHRVIDLLARVAGHGEAARAQTAPSDQLRLARGGQRGIMR